MSPTAAYGRRLGVIKLFFLICWFNSQDLLVLCICSICQRHLGYETHSKSTMYKGLAASNTAKTGEARDSKVFFEGYDLDAMSVDDSQAKSFPCLLVPFPLLLFLQTTQHRVVHSYAVWRRTPAIIFTGHTDLAHNIRVEFSQHTTHFRGREIKRLDIVRHSAVAEQSVCVIVISLWRIASGTTQWLSEGSASLRRN